MVPGKKAKKQIQNLRQNKFQKLFYTLIHLCVYIYHRLSSTISLLSSPPMFGSQFFVAPLWQNLSPLASHCLLRPANVGIQCTVPNVQRSHRWQDMEQRKNLASAAGPRGLTPNCSGNNVSTTNEYYINIKTFKDLEIHREG